ncbi:Putative MHYT domain-containing protein [Septoria linicola]|uniref:MHYT domain-containing protein n=1 Tax=Septoria linicola TaxID=215465 RepID=A0A9Q9EQ54_9PEZI|nr:putative MHYT domain-containing protein [Septoria linicola]USW58409.1 Putative MHYT domain-containing protein [Septoria linicola]
MSSYSAGDSVPSTFDPGIVAASFFASLTGCLLTIEILHRRGTALGNLRSWAETVACATSFGLVGIWCMHFIGNRAIILGRGDPEYQLVYNSGYTVLSVFLPIIGLTIAFSAAELPAKQTFVHWTALVLTGIFAGLSIVGMHYLGNFGVANYKLNYSTRFLAASIVISIGDCLTVLALFYNLREKWISSWWKRVSCALALAGGVSAMHFTASTSCRYEYLHSNGPSDIKSRDTQVIVAGVICGAAAIMIMGVLFVTRARNRLLRSRSQKVMLACAMFDPDGKILVTTEGVLPAREITDKYHHRTFDEDFDTAHPVFQWIFRVTHNWAGVSELVPRMKSHLAAEKESTTAESKATSSQCSAVYDAETYSNYELIFRERFCTAAASLALSIHLPLEHLGVLYDKVIETGTLRVEAKEKRSTISEERTMAEVEAALRLSLFGKGQIMFITRELTQDETDKLLNSGFRFAGRQQVSRSIAQAMQIPQRTLEAHLHDLRRYVESLMNTEKPGTYLAFFAMIPKPNGKGFDIAVRKENQDQLPDVPLLTSKPLQWQASFLEKMDGFRVQQCIHFCESGEGRFEDRTPQEQQFAVMIKQAIIALTLQFPPEWKNEARFWAKPLQAHYSQRLRNRSTLTTLYAFTCIGDMHASIDRSESVSRIPRTFFDTRQRCYCGSPDHAILTKDIHAAFSPLFARKISKPDRNRRRGKLSIALTSSPVRPLKQMRRKSMPIGPGKTPPSRGSSAADHTDEDSSVHELVDRPHHFSGSSRSSDRVRTGDWGGILVNSETVVKTDSKNEFSQDGKDDTQLPMGLRTAVGTAKPETTFVDELVTITKGRFLPASSKSHA